MTDPKDHNFTITEARLAVKDLINSFFARDISQGIQLFMAYIEAVDANLNKEPEEAKRTADDFMTLARQTPKHTAYKLIRIAAPFLHGHAEPHKGQETAAPDPRNVVNTDEPQQSHRPAAASDPLRSVLAPNVR